MDQIKIFQSPMRIGEEQYTGIKKDRGKDLGKLQYVYKDGFAVINTCNPYHFFCPKCSPKEGKQSKKEIGLFIDFQRVA